MTLIETAKLNGSGADHIHRDVQPIGLLASRDSGAGEFSMTKVGCYLLLILASGSALAANPQACHSSRQADAQQVRDEQAPRAPVEHNTSPEELRPGPGMG
jgi:hypothetical protein